MSCRKGVNNPSYTKSYVGVSISCQIRIAYLSDDGVSTRAVGSGLHQFSKSGVEWSHGVLEGLGSLYAAG